MAAGLAVGWKELVFLSGSLRTSTASLSLSGTLLGADLIVPEISAFKVRTLLGCGPY